MMRLIGGSEKYWGILREVASLHQVRVLVETIKREYFSQPEALIFRSLSSGLRLRLDIVTVIPGQHQKRVISCALL